ncbi:hypothetical protein [Hydrotalea sp.]|uniref:hypothetical protein n=1 Tax=Hydrotalea sp. TaxID=2881279 RepID=UPI002623D943|nr:hypothetical protein [Hydrotalea sp.]
MLLCWLACIVPQLESSIEQLNTEAFAGYIPAIAGVATLVWVWLFILAPWYLLIGLLLLVTDSLKLYTVLPKKRKLQALLKKVKQGSEGKNYHFLLPH